MCSIPGRFFLRGAFRGAIRVSLQAILRGYEQRSELRITRGWKLLMLPPPSVTVQTSKRWESPQEGTGRAFPIVSGRPMVGIVGFLQGDRAPSPSVFRQTPPAEAGPWNSETRGPGTQSGAFGSVVCSTSSPRRRQRCAGDGGRIERNRLVVRLWPDMH